MSFEISCLYFLRGITLTFKGNLSKISKDIMRYVVRDTVALHNPF